MQNNYDKAALRKEFDEKFGGEISGWKEDVTTAEEVKAFLDQAYDRIREEALQEALTVLSEEKDERVLTARGNLAFEAVLNSTWNDCRTETIAAIQSLITKK